MSDSTLLIIIFSIIFLGAFAVVEYFYPRYYVKKLKALAVELNCSFNDQLSNQAEQKSFFAKKLIEINGNYRNHQVRIDFYNSYSMLPEAWWRNVAVLVDGQTVTYKTNLAVIFGAVPDLKSAIDSYISKK